MKSLFAYFFTITISIHSVAAFAVDFSDFDSFCDALQQNELKFIKEEVEKGELTQAEAKEEINDLPKAEQCVCFYDKILEGTGVDFTSYIQKLEYGNYTDEEVAKMEVPKYPEGLDIGAFVIRSEVACGLDTE